MCPQDFERNDTAYLDIAPYLSTMTTYTDRCRVRKYTFPSIRATLPLLMVAAFVLPARAQNLIHHWDFETDGVIEDAAADRARNGRLVGGATVAGGVLHLNGSNGYAQLDAHFVPTSPTYTVALFVRTDAGANSGGRREFISQGAIGAAFFVGVAFDGGTVSAGDNWMEVPGARFIADGGYHHYALTMSASEASLYVDGALVASGAPFAGGAGGSATRLGRGTGDSGAYFSGHLDDVRVYSDALDEEQIRDIARIRAQRVPPHAPVHEHTFNSRVSSGSTYSDAEGGSNLMNRSLRSGRSVLAPTDNYRI
jgi:hypothetical protein